MKKQLINKGLKSVRIGFVDSDLIFHSTIQIARSVDTSGKLNYLGDTYKEVASDCFIKEAEYNKIYNGETI